MVIRFRHRAVAVLALLPIVICTWMLIYRIPMGNTNLYRAELSSDESSVYWHIDPHRTASIDLQSGQLTMLTAQEDLDARRNTAPQYQPQLPPNVKFAASGMDEPRLILRNGQGQTTQTIACREMDRFALIGDTLLHASFPNSASKTQRLVLRDAATLRELDAATFLFDQVQVFDFSQIREYKLPVWGENRILLHAPGNKQMPYGSAVLYSVDNKTLVKVAQWPASLIPTGGASDAIYTISAPNQQLAFSIEQRDLSGQLVSTHPVPPELEASSRRMLIHGQFLLTNDKLTCSYYDLKHREMVDLESNQLYRAYGATGAHTIFVSRARGPKYAKAYNVETAEIGPPVAIGQGNVVSVEALSSGDWVVNLRQHGASTTLLNAKDASVKIYSSPFRWAAILLPLAVVAFGLWSLLWVRASIKDDGHPGLDSIVLPGLLTGALLLRSQAVQPEHLLLNYCQGCFFGGLAATSAWMFLGRERLTMRILPFTAVATLLLLSIFYLVDQRLRVEGLVTTLGMATWLALIACAMRLAGFSIHADQPKKSPAELRWTIRDYFLLATAAGLFLLPLRPLVENIDIVAALKTMFSLAAIGPVVIGLATILMLVRSSSWIFSPAPAIASIAVLAVAIPLYRFCRGQYFLEGLLFTHAQTIIGIMAMSLITSFLILYPFTARGWHLGRKPR